MHIVCTGCLSHQLAMASLTMMRAVSGVRAFQGTKARVAPRISNGSDKYTMKRKDSYMVEVGVFRNRLHPERFDTECGCHGRQD